MRAFLDEDRWSAWAADVSALVEGLQKVKDDLERRASAEVERKAKVQKIKLLFRCLSPADPSTAGESPDRVGRSVGDWVGGGEGVRTKPDETK